MIEKWLQLAIFLFKNAINTLKTANAKQYISVFVLKRVSRAPRFLCPMFPINDVLLNTFSVEWPIYILIFILTYWVPFLTRFALKRLFTLLEDANITK